MTAAASLRPAATTVLFIVGAIVVPAIAIAQTPTDLPMFSLIPASRRILATNEQLERLQQWVVAVARHDGGARDQYVDMVSRWPLVSMQQLWVDVQTLARLMRAQNLNAFFVGASDGTRKSVVYTASQLRLMRALACVAAGHGENSAGGAVGSVAWYCAQGKPLTELQPAMRNASTVFADDRGRRGDDNGLLRRAAVLHADIAMSGNTEFAAGRVDVLDYGPRRIRIEVLDGRRSSVTLSGVHWELGEAVLDHIKPRDAAESAPQNDRWVARWYHATLTWLHNTRQYDTHHLQRALELFPGDAELQFVAGCQQEAYASTETQTGGRRAGTLAQLVEAPVAHWKRAESHFRQALQLRQGMPLAALHLGRVRSLLNDHAEAAAHLRSAERQLESAQDRYYAALFLGYAEEHAGAYANAESAYRRALAAAPDAQSALLALSQVMLRRDDRASADAAIAVLLTPAHRADDPWWDYQRSHARDADALIRLAWMEAVR